MIFLEDLRIYLDQAFRDGLGSVFNLDLNKIVSFLKEVREKFFRREEGFLKVKSGIKLGVFK